MLNGFSLAVTQIGFRAHIGLLVCVIHCIAMNPKSAVDLCVCARANLVK